MDPPIKIEPETQEFQDAVAAFREHTKQMRTVAIRFNTGKAEEETKWLDEWFSMHAEGAKLFRKMLQAGAKEYEADAENRPELSEWLSKIVKQDVEADRFEGLLPVIQALVKGNPDSLELHRYLGMTAMAVNDYEAANPSIEKLKQDPNATEQTLELRDVMEQLAASWQEELRMREEDAAGEPLPRVLIRTTKGNLEVELFENQAPETVANFISLVESGVYDHTPFHTGKQHFLIQAGDNISQTPYTIYNETDKPNARHFCRGTLGMALANHPDSAYSQFFVSLLPNGELDNIFTAFGRIVNGIEVLPNLAKIDPEKQEDKSSSKKEPDEIIEIRVLNKRDHEYTPRKFQEN